MSAITYECRVFLYGISYLKFNSSDPLILTLSHTLIMTYRNSFLQHKTKKMLN